MKIGSLQQLLFWGWLCGNVGAAQELERLERRHGDEGTGVVLQHRLRDFSPIATDLENQEEFLSVDPLPDSRIPSRFLRGNESACAAQGNCSACTTHSVWCHWCEHDQACHSRGSPYGCVSGIGCDKKDNGGKDDDDDDDDDDSKSKNNTACAAHTTCTECSLSSYSCHWCGHDNACHAIGSFYGCLTGVDCFSNDRCKRPEPEPIVDPPTDEPTIKSFPLVAILVFSSILACCATMCYCCACGLKGAYDDLAYIAPSDEAVNQIIDDHMMSNDEEDDDAEDDVDPSTPLLADSDPGAAVTTTDASISNPEVSVPEQTGDGDEEDAAVDDDLQPEQAGETDGENQYVQIIDIEEQQQQQREARSVLTGNTTTPRRRGKHVQHMFNICSACYCMTIAIIAGFAYGSIRYFPKPPIYNICNDDVAWKSLFKTMTSMKVEADFQILASVANFNGIDVCVEKNSGGSFRHGNASVGTFDIPPTCIEANSISDILIIAHFSPDRWKSFSIGRDYMSGNLVLEVAAEGTVRVPSLWNFSYHGQFDNIVVHVNRSSDRHFCHCPKWNDEKNSSEISLLEEFSGEIGDNLLAWELPDV